MSNMSNCALQRNKECVKQMYNKPLHFLRGKKTILDSCQYQEILKAEVSVSDMKPIVSCHPSVRPFTSLSGFPALVCWNLGHDKLFFWHITQKSSAARRLPNFFFPVLLPYFTLSPAWRLSCGWTIITWHWRWAALHEKWQELKRHTQKKIQNTKQTQHMLGVMREKKTAGILPSPGLIDTPHPHRVVVSRICTRRTQRLLCSGVERALSFFIIDLLSSNNFFLVD